MSRERRNNQLPSQSQPSQNHQRMMVEIQSVQRVASLYDEIKDGSEYQSILSFFPPENSDIVDEAVRAIKAIEKVRGRKCLAYAGNVVKPQAVSAINSADDLPFAEMVACVPKSETAVDILLATSGGSGQQVNRFVNALRSRFQSVEILIPNVCMSAGTIFALSANKIWMSERACLGPIDPQVPTKDGRYVPAQALLLLVQKLQEEGEAGLRANKGVPWSAIRTLDGIDKKELAEAITASSYAIQLATQYLTMYKFSDWSTREASGQAVTQEYKVQRATEIASALVSHDRWKNHGHAISRDVLWQEIQLKIDRPNDDLERALRKAWAIFTWIFDKTPVQKLLASTDYRLVINSAILGVST